MTRFVMLLNDACNLLNYSIKYGKQGEIIIQKAKSLKIIDLADAVAELMKVKLLNVKKIGIRHGEKLHEVLASEEEMMRCRENKKYIHIPLDGRGINYEIYFDKGKKLKRRKLYSSNNTKKLSKLEIKKTLLKDMIVRSLIK